MPKKPPEVRLGRLELQIMNVVWDRSSATVHDVKKALSRGRKPAYSTILTMMRKLEAKGYLEHEVNERTYVYQATISRQAVRKSMLGDLLERAFEGSPALLMSSLVEQNSISEDELREIRKLIGPRRRQNE
jgi:predicted transcriptional regulator